METRHDVGAEGIFNICVVGKVRGFGKNKEDVFSWDFSF